MKDANRTDAEAADIATLAGAGIDWNWGEGRSSTVRDLYREYIHFLRPSEPGYDAEADGLRLRERRIFDSLAGTVTDDLERADASLDALMEAEDAAHGGIYFSDGEFRDDYMRSYRLYVDGAVDSGDITREVGEAATRQMRRDLDRIIGGEE